MIPSEDEWYKSAYHYNDGMTGNYYDYPTSSDSVPSNDLVTTGGPAPTDQEEGPGEGGVVNDDTGDGGIQPGETDGAITDQGAPGASSQETAAPSGAFCGVGMIPVLPLLAAMLLGLRFAGKSNRRTSS